MAGVEQARERDAVTLEFILNIGEEESLVFLNGTAD